MTTATATHGDIDVLPPSQLPAQGLSSLHSAQLDKTRPPSGATRPDLSRSASFSYLSGRQHEGPSVLKRTISENVLALRTGARTAKDTPDRKPGSQVLSSGSWRRKERRRLSVATFTLAADEDDGEGSSSSSSNENDNNNRKGEGRHGRRGRSTAALEPESKGLSRSVTGTIKSLARKSWMPSSRPSSPAPNQAKSEAAAAAVTSANAGVDARPRTSRSPSKKAAVLALHTITLPQSPASSPQTRSGRPSTATAASAASAAATAASAAPAAAPAAPAPAPAASPARSRSTHSIRRLYRKASASSVSSSPSRSPFRSRASSPVGARIADDAITDDMVPPLPPSISTDHLAGVGVDPVKRKDPLSGAFRAIETEFTSFQTKTSLQRAKVVRTSLLPFLAKYAHHPSNGSLRAEDLDRRVVILNKWWTGILDMLTGGSNLSITGTDRPAYLDAAAQLMMRPEWMAPGFGPSPSPSATPPLQQQQLQQPVRRPWPTEAKASTTSLRSAESDFLAETIYQNVRNSFVQNLLFQLAYVVEKLSLRSAPASLVTFGGKTCAYAFFFCPGVASMLVRLWRLPPAALRRVFAEAGVGPGEKLEPTADTLAARFPPPLRSLRVTTLAQLARTIQPNRQLPPGTEEVAWYGPWLGRWCGRDSDLFFVFVKHFHLLVVDMLQELVSPKDRICIPGLAPVHAQILVVLETTIYRQAVGPGQQQQHAVDLAHRGIDGADALASLPLTIANASRMIAENRLVMVLRDLLSDRATSDHPLLRDLYASSFCDILKAAARKISLYNNDACFVLCDFLEEILPILTRHQPDRSDTSLAVDWPFWMQVCRLMARSHNTLTHVRLIVFIYSTWSIWTSDDQRKRALVLDWLLDPTFFDQHFCHWSPMVRHYYFRLLCWRLGRCDNDPPSLLDLTILETLAARLNRCWAHYQYLSAEADMRNLCPPSTTPCSPAPSRYLVIMRTDNQSLPTNALSSFDTFLSQGLVNQNSSYQTRSPVMPAAAAAPAATGSNPASANTGTKKRWSLLKMLGPLASGTPNSRPGEVTPPPSPSPEQVIQTPPSGTLPSDPASSGDRPTHLAFSFRFSLEWVEGRNDAHGASTTKLHPPRIPTIGQRTLNSQRGSLSSCGSGSGRSDSRKSVHRPEIAPLKPTDRELTAARYSGRALAEWAQVLAECRSFYHRRKQEGVPSDSLVETPTMGVETFRMLG